MSLDSRLNMGDTDQNTACCPDISVYIHNETLPSNGTGETEECSYIVCDIKGYTKWQSVASCLGRSVIVEGEAHVKQQEGDGVNPDSVRGCAFNGAGLDEENTVKSGDRRRIEGIGWGLLIYGIFGVLVAS
jgi:hypothetical protein